MMVKIKAQMAELVDALVSGTSVRKDVEVRVFFWAPNFKQSFFKGCFFISMSIVCNRQIDFLDYVFIFFISTINCFCFSVSHLRHELSGRVVLKAV